MTRVLFLTMTPGRAVEPWLSAIEAEMGGRHPITIFDETRDAAPQMNRIDVVIDVGGWGTNDVIDAAGETKVKLWQVLGYGLDHIDVAHVLKRGLTLSHTPGPMTAVALAEHCLLLMLAVEKRFAEMQRNVRSGVFFEPTCGELAGKTLTVIGFGTSGKELAKRAWALGMRIVAVDVVRVGGPELTEGHVSWFGLLDRLDEALSEADYVSLHVPLTRETRRLIDARALGLMSGAVLINVSRGAVVDEAALIEALQAGRLRGAGLDVFEREPLPPDHPLFGLDNKD